MNWGHWFQITIGIFSVHIAAAFKGESISVFQSVLLGLICCLFFKIDGLKKG